MPRILSISPRFVSQTSESLPSLCSRPPIIDPILDILIIVLRNLIILASSRKISLVPLRLLPISSSWKISFPFFSHPLSISFSVLSRFFSSLYFHSWLRILRPPEYHLFTNQYHSEYSPTLTTTPLPPTQANTSLSHYPRSFSLHIILITSKSRPLSAPPSPSRSAH